MLPASELDRLDALRLLAKQRLILDALVAVFPRVASTDRLTEAAWEAIGEEEPGLTQKGLSEHICRLRKALASLGYGVEVVYKQGWRLVRLADVQRAAA